MTSRNLLINDVKDLKKLEGWHIEKAFLVIENADPVVGLVLNNIGAPNPVLCKFRANVSFGRSGNVMIANSNITIITEDLINAAAQTD